MSVSSSIGSNIFDITVGLGLPWILFIIVYQIPVKVESAGLITSVLVLLGVVVLLLVTLQLNYWLLTPKVGVFLVILYCAYIAQQCAITPFTSC